MELRIVNNHLLVDVQTDLGIKTCVVDTGSPLSFFYYNVQEFSIDGNPQQVSPLVGVARMALPTREEIEGLVGATVEGFIGSDTMQKYGNVLIDLHNHKITFCEVSVSATNPVQMNSLMGLPTFIVSFNGIETRTAFDTGAMYSFVSSDICRQAALAPAHGTFTDYHPGHGSFEAELHSGVISIGNHELGICDIATAPYYDNILSMLGVSGFIGIDTLLDSAILISYRDNMISLI